MGEIEAVLESGDANWEIQRFAGVDHGFTRPGDARYSLIADSRSWASMHAAFINHLASPIETVTVFDIIAMSPDHRELTDLVVTYGLTDALNTSEALTVFAPTDAAFDNLFALIGTNLPDAEMIVGTLLYHVVDAKVMSSDIVPGAVSTLLESSELCIDVVDGEVVINGVAKVTIADIEASNGVVHVIDAVLMPPDEESNCTAGQTPATDAPVPVPVLVPSPTNAPVSPPTSAPVPSPTSAPDDSEGVTIYNKNTLILSGVVASLSALAIM